MFFFLKVWLAKIKLCFEKFIVCKTFHFFSRSILMGKKNEFFKVFEKFEGLVIYKFETLKYLPYDIHEVKNEIYRVTVKGNVFFTHFIGNRLRF